MEGILNHDGGASGIARHLAASRAASGDSLVFCPVKAKEESSLPHDSTRIPAFSILAIHSASPRDRHWISNTPPRSVTERL
jgi:hypothetical protein